jgi:hypothetical protein
VEGISYVSKRTYFRDSTVALSFNEDQINWNVPGDSYEIQTKVLEYAFAKLCSAMGLGIKVGSPDHSFDVVCYDNFIEFFMERGSTITEVPQS